MITADELIDGSAISESLQDMGDSLIDVILSIMSGIIEVFFIWIKGVMLEDILGANPAILLIGVAFFITAYLILRGRQ